MSSQVSTAVADLRALSIGSKVEKPKMTCVPVAGDDDEGLFNPPPRENCPICLIRLPIENGDLVYLACCGNTVCIGCPHENKRVLQKEHQKAAERSAGGLGCAPNPLVKPLESYPCPFCRRSLPYTDDEILRRMRERMDLGDAKAYFNMAGYCREGLHGVPIDERRALELLHRAAELGSPEASSDLCICYLTGSCGVEKDLEKSREYLISAAKGGLPQARHNLGVMEYEDGHVEAAIKHLSISTASGYRLSLECMEELRDEGHISDEYYASALRDLITAQKEEYSKERAAARRERLAKAT